VVAEVMKAEGAGVLLKEGSLAIEVESCYKVGRMGKYSGEPEWDDK
jgi:hypothetical protein